MIFVTGGAGFIGSNFILDWFRTSSEPILNIDKLTYAGNMNNLAALSRNASLLFEQLDIGCGAQILRLLRQHQPRALVHLAAESHVDRCIDAPATAISTNINGTFALLEAARSYWNGLDAKAQRTFRFLHVSTDEVFGSLGPHDPPFSETTPYAPNSPYAASKAASDHLVRACHHTYGLPTLTTHCSNNYGPRQFPEKLIALMITNAVAGKNLPIYGDGKQVRDWIHVSDHCAALREVLAKGTPGAVYNVGGQSEMTNLAVLHTVCDMLDRMAPKSGSYRDQIIHVCDRPGHDRRYAIDARKIECELGWRAGETFQSGIEKTVKWYLSHPDWVVAVESGAYMLQQASRPAERDAP